MKIGVYLSVNKTRGGVYQYSLNLLEILKNISGHEYFILNFSSDLPRQDFQMPNWHISDFSYNTTFLFDSGVFSLLIGYLEKINFRPLEMLIFKIKNWLLDKKIEKIIRKENIELIIFPASFNRRILKKFPSLAAIHDIQHRLNPQFPEVSQKGAWEKRERNYQLIAKHAYKILVDSQIGKEDVANAYEVDHKKITILQFLPPAYLKADFPEKEKNEFIKRHNLPEKFIFYPAQFWPHKNHKNLIEALKILKDQKIIIPLVLTGSKTEWGEFEKIMQLIKNYDMENQIFYLGYVENKEISLLYKLATALVMPTFLGPTNIPVLEAWQMGCPVLYSNIRGCREQAGSAALLFSPESPADMARKIKDMWQNEELRADFVNKGKARLADWTKDDFTRTLNELFINFKNNYE